jgi:hypothetical protein
MMQKILNNKQIIHLVTEVVVLIGIIFYFSSKNRKLLSHIEDLSQRLEEQEDIIQKHDQIIKRLAEGMSQIAQRNMLPPVNNFRQNSSSLKSGVRFAKIAKKKVKKAVVKAPVKAPVKVQEVSSVEEEYSSTDDDDIDAELQDELEDLVEDDSLKKSTLVNKGNAEK